MLSILIKLVGVTTAKIIIFLVILFAAYRWSHGGFNKKIGEAKRIGHKYGLITLALLILWWILTPTGSPDDLITVWLIDNISLTYYIVLVVGLSMYLLWRLKITITIYRK